MSMHTIAHFAICARKASSKRGRKRRGSKLSQERADMVRSTLMTKGVEVERLVSEGAGESQPLVKGTSEAAREKNRRVEFIIEYK